MYQKHIHFTRTIVFTFLLFFVCHLKTAEIHDAAKKGDVAKIQKLLHANVDPDCLDETDLDFFALCHLVRTP